MKQCPKCNASNTDTAKFCVECGCNIKKYEEEQAKPKARFCPECGTEIHKGSFCPECGHNVGNNLNSMTTAATSDTFGDDWLSDLESSTNADVATTKEKKSKEQMDKALAAFEYEEHTDGTYTIVALKDKHALNITVPDGVVAIADHAFEGCEAFSISLPEGLLKIGDSSFKNSQDLSKINLPESLFSIGNEAFMACALLEVEIPASVKKVGKDVIKNTATDIRRMKEEEKKKAEAARKKAEAEAKQKAEEIRKSKAAAKEKLNAYNNRENYRKAEIKEIEAILMKAENDIDTCNDIQAVERVVSTVKVKLDAIKTDVMLSFEEKQKLEKRKAEEAKKLKKEKDALSAKWCVGSVHTFGTYSWNEDGTKAPIEWVVGENNGEWAFLFTKYAIDTRPYNEEIEDVTWESCDLRKWLNEDFYNDAFSLNEKQNIGVGTQFADANPMLDVYPGNNTQDKVFLLSGKEAESHFPNDEARKGTPTPYALAKLPIKNILYWWLRTPGMRQSRAMVVATAGTNEWTGAPVTDNWMVRPGIWVKIH